MAMTTAHELNTTDRYSILQGVLPITADRIPAEIIAGITLAALAVPEVMGYTKIAGTPVITGLYTVLIPAALVAVFGSSRHLVVGADSATAAILAGLSGTFVVNGSPTKTQMVDSAGGRTQLSLLVMVAIVLVILLFLTAPLAYMPEAVLAAIVFLIGVDLIDLAGMRRVFQQRRNSSREPPRPARERIWRGLERKRSPG
jgi:SulP family sulfate permease